MTTNMAYAVSMRVVPYWRDSHSSRRVIGRSVELTLSDGSTVTCEHAHTTRYNIIQCARLMKLRYAG